MRLLLLAAIVSLVGCATGPDVTRGCSVFRDVGGKSTPMGLILLPSVLADSLRQQLPETERSRYVCWYTSGERLIVGERKNPNSFVYGYSFIKQDGVWRLADESPEILAVPRAID
jgi:hypothetical protein